MFISKWISFFIPSFLIGHEIESYLHSVGNKSGLHWMAQIDFVYCIHRDRHALYKILADFAPFGIYPCPIDAIREENLSSQALDELGVTNIDKIFSPPLATVFRHFGMMECVSYEIMDKNDATYYSHSISKSSICNILDHLSILQDAYNSSYKAIWVLEEEVRIESNPNELSRYVSMLNVLAPDWDVLYTEPGKHLPINVPYRPNVPQKTQDYYCQYIPLNENLTKIGMHLGSSSMVISHRGIKKILDYFKYYKFFFPYAIDCCFIPGIQLFKCNREIVKK